MCAKTSPSSSRVTTIPGPREERRHITRNPLKESHLTQGKGNDGHQGSQSDRASGWSSRDGSILHGRCRTARHVVSLRAHPDDCQHKQQQGGLQREAH
ncbi:hypothetical protein B296_00046860 [Ensete ventricosum]|uniref:Uncharacterized protein n=1 Tax=Ensete ventricosum TaxID=4639 RepID=A0A426XFI8_ENSVE|nr:hypothetical protein B296_00046860 [Ensete ventricosum]